MLKRKGKVVRLVKKAALIIMFITLMSKILGLGRELTLSYFYGATNISDAYFISMTIPIFIFTFITSGLNAGYIPTYTRILQDHGTAEANRFTSNLINILLVLCAVIVLFVFLFTDEIVRLFASGFKGETLSLTVKMTNISILSIFFAGIVTIFSGYLQIKKAFAASASIAFPLDFFIIVSIILSSMVKNTSLLAVGYVFATASQLLFLIPFLKKNDFKYEKTFNIKDKHIINLGYLMLPLIIGISVDQINVLVDRTMASRIAVGGISTLSYADRLNSSIRGLFAVPFVTALYPMISKMVAEKNFIGFKKMLAEAITCINLLTIPSAICAMIFAVPITALLFGRGAFDQQAIRSTSQALYFYSIGMIGFGLRPVLIRAFHSMQDTKTPMINGTMSTALNIALNIILSRYMGISGLALATSISALFTTILLFLNLRKRIGSFGMKQILSSFLKISFASVIMGTISKISYNHMISILTPNLTVMIALTIAFVSYVSIIYFMKIEEVEVVIRVLKDKLKLEN